MAQQPAAGVVVRFRGQLRRTSTAGVARFDVTSFARFRNFGVDGQGGSGFGRDALDSELVGADADINNTCGSDA